MSRDKTFLSIAVLLAVVLVCGCTTTSQSVEVLASSNDEVTVTMYVFDEESRELVNGSEVTFVDLRSGENQSALLEEGSGSILLQKTPVILTASHYRVFLSAPGYQYKTYNTSFYEDTTVYFEL